MMKIFFLLISIGGIFLISCSDKKEKDYKYKPVIVGDWWEITGNPDLGEYTSENQEPVDFGVWQAEDGTWQLWSCIRKTNCGGRTRLFYGWEGKSLTDTMWTPLGIVMEADTTVGVQKGGLQAPHVIQKDGMYYMLYGGWAQICLAKSSDGKTFERVINDSGTTEIFSGPFINTRDAMTVKISDKYYCYYTGHLLDAKPDEISAAIFCRTSADLISWSEPTMVSAGGSVKDMDSWGGGDAECPFVVPIDDKFVLFRNVEYGRNNLNVQYCSENPLEFGIDTDSLMLSRLPIAAPEIVKLGDDYFIFALKETLDGIRAARLEFEMISSEQ
ncbi:glycoside hydrolase family protein [Maribellus maritimus]|uniref:hypothetical protein n=1 Tax=Maribellus maritimus TaxID=2870838 RepID=UPI001EEA0E6F|nr:hypothetical protein [Maribellus maritimus]MCG6186199.1 hypothetical protein [Maribellus maritimus]